jgi:hypothetical protein
MNPIDDQLNRLFRSAAKGTPAEGNMAPVPAPAYGLETRALAAWRAGQSAETGFWDMALLTRGLIVASLIMAASFLPVLNSSSTSTSTESTTNPFAEFLQLTDSTVPSDDAP